ncbi:MAG: hypothetical protein VSS75_030785 [Candidatus Parabeggiatoa sp.]|nr:hypothetical protein [Candidatus Parabeggiatoa sp.]
MINETPYPRLGEVVHFVSHAFGLFGEADLLSLCLKRFAQDSDFNLATANRLIDFSQGMGIHDPKCGQTVWI